MSAFVVSELTIRRVVAVLSNGINGERLMPFIGGISTEDYENVDRIGAALWALNVAAVNGRYPNETPAEAPTYVHRHVKVSLVDAYKALFCLIYQCEEDATKSAPLLVDLREARDRLAHYIVVNLPEFVESKAWQ